mgnify:FL=1
MPVLLLSPLIAYFMLLLTVGILASIGVDVRDIDTVSMFVIYVEIIVMLTVLRWLKRKVNT